MRRRSRFASLVLLIACLSAACGGSHTLVRRDVAGLPAIEWLSPQVAADAAALGRWRISVGPPVTVSAPLPPQPSDALAIVSWNTALGAGDVPTFVAGLRRSLKPGTPVILLLQEVYRAGAEVPTALPSAAGFASRIRGFCADGRRDEVESLAAELGMSAYYVPSMRNGGPLLSDEDRGNAILSDLPLDGFSAVELPFERQRRVAVAATASGVDAAGQPWRLRLVSAHLDNMVGAKRLWIAGGEYGRARQARGLLSSILDDGALVVGGDFNTWFGFSDRAYVETALKFPQTVVSDRRATFRGILRLDHLFYRLPDAWTASFRRADSRYGSDHYPLIATVNLSAARTGPEDGQKRGG